MEPARIHEPLRPPERCEMLAIARRASKRRAFEIRNTARKRFPPASPRWTLLSVLGMPTDISSKKLLPSSEPRKNHQIRSSGPRVSQSCRTRRHGSLSRSGLAGNRGTSSLTKLFVARWRLNAVACLAGRVLSSPLFCWSGPGWLFGERLPTLAPSEREARLAQAKETLQSRRGRRGPHRQCSVVLS